MTATDPPRAARVLPGTEEAIAEGARLLRAGGLVAFPTETVYGLGADATRDEAVARVFAAKGRPEFNPLIVHFADADGAKGEVEWPETAARLAARFWPGPLTLVLPRREGCTVSRLASAGLDTLAVRVPAHPLAHALLAAAGCPVAAPSANRSGALSPTSAEHVAQGLGDAVDLVLDGGTCQVGLESTVLHLGADGPALLRPGGLALEEIEAEVGPVAHERAGREDPARPRSPGMTLRHYAPRTPLRLDATTVAADEALIAFGPAALEGARVTFNLSEEGDLVEAAANLFVMLHAADGADARRIAVMPIPEAGLGLAINDRLRRAAAGG